ncbi:MAG: UxaA family hydrolase [Actinobacteria bacterium]|nr:UxaA family hydrolase [Actinomycetota bacterium]MBO0784855.1 UxaA family hydrolase [Actinomycetota bacterium]
MPETCPPPPPGELAFLVHREGDDVAVAVRETEPGEAAGALLDTGQRFSITVRTPIPLGHKVALADLAENQPVTEYGVTIGLARSDITAGELVHTHNIRSARWRSSL